MVWVKPPDFFCAASKMIAENENVYTLDLDSTLMVYPPMAGAYNNADGATAYTNRLQYVEVYMDNLLCATQGDPTQQ